MYNDQCHPLCSLYVLDSPLVGYNLSPGPLWSFLWSWTLNFILHTFLHPIIIFFSQHMPIPAQPVLLQYQCYVIHTKSLSQLLTYSLLSQRDDQCVNYLCQDEEWGGLGWTSRAGCGDGKFVADGNYYAASYVHMRPTATDGVAWSVYVEHTGELCKNG